MPHEVHMNSITAQLYHINFIFIFSADPCSDSCERFWYTRDGDVTDTCEDDENEE